MDDDVDLPAFGRNVWNGRVNKMQSSKEPNTPGVSDKICCKEHDENVYCRMGTWIMLQENIYNTDEIKSSHVNKLNFFK